MVRQNQGIKQSNNLITIVITSLRQMDEGARNLRRIVSFKQISFKTIFPSNLTQTGSEFHRIGVATESSGSSFHLHPWNVKIVTTD